MRESYQFENKMTFWEKAAAAFYLPVHVFIFPVLIHAYAYATGYAMSEVTANTIYYGAGIIFVFVFMWKFLRKSFDVMLDDIGRSASSLGLAVIFDLSFSYMAAFLVLAIMGDLDNPNSESIDAIANINFNAMFGIAVFMAPIVEEILFRGLIFGSLRRRSRILAYVVCTLVFSLYHVWQFAAVSLDATYLVYALQYVPVTIALCWCYERSGSIWVPIFMHMLRNAISFMISGI